MQVSRINNNTQNFGALKMTPEAMSLISKSIKNEGSLSDLRRLKEIAMVQKHNDIDIHLDTVVEEIPASLVTGFDPSSLSALPEVSYKIKALSAKIGDIEMFQSIFRTPLDFIKQAVNVVNEMKLNKVYDKIDKGMISEEKYIEKELNEISKNIEIK